MEEKNTQTPDKESQLGDIVLDKGYVDGGNKKLLLAVGILSVILIIVVVFMRLSSEDTPEVSQNKLPPEPTKILANDPLFEPVEIDDFTDDNQNLDKIAKKLKEESFGDSALDSSIEDEDFVIIEPVDEVVVDVVQKRTPPPVKKVVKREPAPVKKSAPKYYEEEVSVFSPIESSKPAVKQSKPKAVASGKYYIQVGSFAKYSPDKKFLKSINTLGYDYTFHKVKIGGREMNKVLVGPFSTDKKARESIRTIRKNIEPSAFMIKI
ncbi:MAG: SPOR domain-containing protein [Campylobacterota bacterium]|nr:SPOR domain-containing protein [Campylobacterota bacterium]